MKALAGLLLLFFSPLLRAQEDAAFIEHLHATGQYEQAAKILHLEQALFSSDTLNFFLGISQHFLRRHDSAVHYLRKVPQSSPLHPAALCYGVLNALYGRDFYFSWSVPSESTTELAPLYTLLQAGQLLLQRDLAGFDSIAGFFSKEHYLFQASQQRLLHVRAGLPARHRSPLTAAMLSALVPGSGKFYAGRKGAGLSAFFTNVMLAGFAAESWYRSGFNSPQFITFGTIFGFFYAGNIYGSVYSVKQQIRTDNGKINHEVLGALHGAVVRVFAR